jgi:hypothetical protein
MSDKLLSYSPQYLRGRAKQTRAMAKPIMSEATRSMLERRAAEYERMADLQEQQAGIKMAVKAAG